MINDKTDIKIDWKRKLSSRKFWAMLGGQATAMLTVFNVSDSVILQVTAVIGSLGIFAVYMLAEAYVDGKRGDSESDDAIDEATIKYK